LLNKWDDYKIYYPPTTNHCFIEASASPEGCILNLNTNELDNLYFPEEIKEEIPNKKDLRDCLLASGCIDYKNKNEVSEIVKNRIRNSHKKLYISIDTNILYQRFISRSELKNERIVIAKTVITEIERAMNYKYNQKNLRKIKSFFGAQSHFLDELFNKRMKKSRKAAYLAMKEYEILDRFITDEYDMEVKDYSEIDLKIVRELKKFEKDAEVGILFLTADDCMTDLCIMDELEFFLFEIPQISNRIECSFKQFRALILNLATIFGFIQLNSAIIFGEFKGKIKNKDDLKIRFENNSIYKEVKKEIKICRELAKLKFDF
ncbi:MAG: PIN domain-containing protein, partial [Candidatus Helarchaeota archaeon]